MIFNTTIISKIKNKQPKMSNKVCKICYDANRPGYNTHWMKDTSGNVLCPYLANLKCKHCGYTGHTQKYCKMPAKNIRAKPTINKDKIIEEITKKDIVNIYNILMVESDDEDLDNNHIKINVMDMPFLCQEINQVVSNDEDDYWKSEIIWGKGTRDMIGRSWADIVGA